MKTILYIGNHLSRGGAYPSVAESMAPRFLPELRLHLVSGKRNRVLRLLDMLWAIFQDGSLEQPVVIDVYSTLNFYYALVCALLCRLLGIRYCCVLHGGNLPQRLRRNQRLSRFLFSGAERLIAPSGYLQEAFARAGYEAMVVPNFLPIENYPFRWRERPTPRLLWVRAFDQIYRPELAIRVLHRLLKRWPEAQLCMVGPDKDGSMAGCKSLAAKLGIAGQVTFTGRLPKAEWVDLAADYDIFINTTDFDNMPVSVLEAMALGFPVVTTNVGGLPWLVKHGVNGLLVPPADEDAFTAAVAQLLEYPTLASTLSRNARQKAETFAWERVKQQWLDLLREVK